MEIKKVSIFLKEYPICKALQKRAFPKEEQYPFWLLRLMTLRDGIDYWSYYDEDRFCGITYTSATEHMLYILYFAVNDDIRSNGYGTRILNLLKEKNEGKELTLNVELLDEQADNYMQRKKRMDFYYRNGFCDTGYYLVDVTGKYTILSTAEQFSVTEYKKVIAQIGMNLYKPNVVAK